MIDGLANLFIGLAAGGLIVTFILWVLLAAKYLFKWVPAKRSGEKIEPFWHFLLDTGFEAMKNGGFLK